MTTDFYTPQPEWAVQQYGYWPGNTYWLNGYRMYLSDQGYFYYVDHPEWLPVKASRPHYRTGGIPGIFLKWIGVISFPIGICLMFVDSFGMVAFGSILIFFGMIGTLLAIVDSVRNHPQAWKFLLAAAVVAYVAHEVTDDD